MACDICGKPGTRLVELLSSYQTAEVKEICPDCETVINKQSYRLTSFIANIKITLLKRFIRERHERFTKEKS